VSPAIRSEIYLADSQSSSEHPDILENISATSAHLDFISTGYRSHLSAQPSTTERHMPSEGELESHVPSLPTGWALGGQKPTPSQSQPKKVVKKEAAEKPKSGRRHKLPKGAVEGKLSNEDVRPLLSVSQPG
jgi:signal recognition particle subunit SRP72